MRVETVQFLRDNPDIILSIKASPIYQRYIADKKRLSELARKYNDKAKEQIKKIM